MSAGAKRKQLGRGLSSLLGKDTSVEDIKSTNINQAISISNIQPGAGQPRRVFDDEELSALAKSIQERGVLHGDKQGLRNDYVLCYWLFDL